jgi:predicted AlkP superfamily phosphohydrolase/phosphomutase
VAAERVLIIGLDGATLDIVEPLVREGRCPTFARLMERGAWGPLQSTIPPLSPPAWASFITGNNPGKHGVFSFFSTDDRGRRSVVNSMSVHGSRYWDILGGEGRRVAVLNMPLTYPPRPLNGVQIAGMLTPSERSIFTYPPELHTELIRECGDYPLELIYMKALRRHGLIEGIKVIYRLTDTLERAALYLMDRSPWDVFTVIFRGPDMLQHYIFKALGPAVYDPEVRRVKKLGEALYQLYERMDSAIATLWSRFGEDCTVIVMSDHGGGPTVKGFSLAQWLIEEGLLRLKGMTGLRSLRIGKPIRPPGGFRKYLPGKRRWDLRSAVPRVIHSPHSMVDWENTRAFPDVDIPAPSLRINVKGREPHGCVEQGGAYDRLIDDIRERLLAVQDPETGQSVIDRVYRKDEIFWGPFTERCADIYFVPRDWSYKVIKRPGKAVIHRVGRTLGAHRLEGLLFMEGPSIRSCQVKDAQIMDCAPTILYLSGCSIPEEVDGRVLVEVFDEDSLVQRPIRYSSAVYTAEQGAQHIFSDQEQRALEENLRGLGYID